MRLLIIIFLLIAQVDAQESFNLRIDVPAGKVLQGEPLVMNIKLVNLGSTSREDVILEYWVVDNASKLVYSNKETVAVETQANFVKTIALDSKPGSYQAGAKILYSDGREGLALHSFNVVSPETDFLIIYLMLFVFCLGLIGFFGLRSGRLIKKLQIRLQIKKIIRKQTKT